jgi:hypothetical protein
MTFGTFAQKVDLKRAEFPLIAGWGKTRIMHL